MKKSYYNIETIIDNEVLIYNGIAESLVSLNLEEYDLYCKDNLMSSLEESTIKKMIDCGILVDSEINELEIIKKDLENAKSSKSSMSVVIAPTLDCNFDCEYCYEKNAYKKQVFSQESIDSIFRYINYRKNDLASLNLVWTGGEPLLKTDLIDTITSQIINQIEGTGIAFTSYIITNGYLLTSETLEMLNRNQIYTLQITLDGTEDEHNKSRPHVSGRGTFSAILSNIEKNYNLINKLIIRINVDKENDKNYLELSKIIKKLDHDRKIKINVSKIEDTNNSYDCKRCYNNDEFINFQLNEVYKIDESLIRDLYPKRRNRYCLADGLYDMVISPDGLIYKCWADLGFAENAVGDINRFISFIDRSTLFDYYDFDPTNDLDCKVCKFLPVCLGGCSKRRIEFGEKSCLYNDDSFRQIISSYYNDLVHE